ncbi:hypothetical protein DFS33DRAFT_1271214 [Desarmillaria ectypa]|nr:hypothetical protein DFS33DRAFT_1271214 [Desarmillaria ectypa]
MDFLPQAHIPPPYSVVDPLLWDNQHQSSQSIDPALWSNLYHSLGNNISSIPGEVEKESKDNISHPSLFSPSPMLPPSVMGGRDFRGLSDMSGQMLPPDLPNGLIHMDVPDMETPAAGRHRSGKAKSRATHKNVARKEVCGMPECEVCSGPIEIKEGRWNVCPKCTYALLNMPEEPNPLYRMGGQAAFKCVYPESDDFLIDHIDNGTGVFQALYATYLHYLREERTLQSKVGITHANFQALIKTNASKRAYTKFGIKPPMSFGEEVVDETFYGDSDSDSELSDSPALGEAGPSTCSWSSSRTRK